VEATHLARPITGMVGDVRDDRQTFAVVFGTLCG
jgi:hypothetical protein